jgi:hypothetical protein
MLSSLALSGRAKLHRARGRFAVGGKPRFSSPYLFYPRSSVPGGTRPHHPFYQPLCRFFRGFLEFKYHREIRSHPRRREKREDFAVEVQQRKRHSRVLPYFYGVEKARRRNPSCHMTKIEIRFCYKVRPGNARFFPAYKHRYHHRRNAPGWRKR